MKTKSTRTDTQAGNADITRNRRKAELLADCKEKLLAHESITVEQIELIAEAVGYTIHGRTLGFMRKRVVNAAMLEDGSVRVCGYSLTSLNGFGTANVIRELYARIRQQAEVTEPQPDTATEMAEISTAEPPAVGHVTKAKQYETLITLLAVLQKEFAQLSTVLAEYWQAIPRPPKIAPQPPLTAPAVKCTAPPPRRRQRPRKQPQAAIGRRRPYALRNAATPVAYRSTFLPPPGICNHANAPPQYHPTIDILKHIITQSNISLNTYKI